MDLFLAVMDSFNDNFILVLVNVRTRPRVHFLKSC
jgi:hypothetical protein